MDIDNNIVLQEVGRLYLQVIALQKQLEDAHSADKSKSLQPAESPSQGQ